MFILELVITMIEDGHLLLSDSEVTDGQMDGQTEVSNQFLEELTNNLTKSFFFNVLT